MNIVSRIFKALVIFIGLSLSSAHVQPAQSKITSCVNVAEVACDAARIACTNIAMHKASEAFKVNDGDDLLEDAY